MITNVRLQLVGLFFSMFVLAQAVNKKPFVDFDQKIFNQFNNQLTNYPQEKLYLQTDKPYYSAGEEIWFKGYLVNAATLDPNTLSQFIYVELIDKRDSVLSRVKIKRDSLGFDGYISLKPELSKGNYAIRAYSYWMQNTGKDFFYTKNVLIGNAIDDHISSKISFGVQVDGVIPATLTFTDAQKNPIVGKKVELTETWDSAKKKYLTLVTGKDGKIDWKINVTAKDSSKKNLEVSIVEEKYKTNIILPEFNRDFDVQFLPESGVLLSNLLQSVAFKAIGKDGLSVSVTGKIYTDKNEEIAEMSSLHNGMGKFSIHTQPNERYYALVKAKNGAEKRFELPLSQVSGVAIHLLYSRNKILYEVINHTSKQNKSLFLLIHSKAKVSVIQRLDSLEGQISESKLPVGITSFSVIDSLGHTFCERLSFVRNLNFPTISMKQDKASYGNRVPVDLTLDIKSMLGKSVKGSFSVSVTDNKTVKLDSLSDNMLTNLLLCSDLKGYIEEPATYFADNRMSTREKTDVLMMTQGWTRFSTAEVVKSVYKEPKFYLEEGQALSGKVLNLFNSPSKKCDVIVISPYKKLVKTATTDSVGRYVIDGIEFPDSTNFILKARKSKSITDVEIIPDSDIFPVSKVFLPTPYLTATPTVEELAYFNQVKEKYYYEGGMRLLNLGEVTVTAAKKDDSRTEFYSGMASSTVTAEQLATYPGFSIMDMLHTVSGLQITGSKISIRGANGNPMFMVDGVEVSELSEISYLTTNDVEKIEVFKGPAAAIFGSRGANGVIAISLKEGVDLVRPTPISLVKYIPLGYQKPKLFYVPKYEVDSVLKNPNPDLRTTIYWNPKLVSDANGSIHLNFYTADKASNYSVVLEGITVTGEICRYVGNLKR